MIALIISGITASFVETELKWLLPYLNAEGWLAQWLSNSLEGITLLNENYPQLAYGFDWLAFGHVVIAGFFIGPLLHPVQNRWVILYGIIACLAVFPVVFLAGYFRNIPLTWQYIDCAFGVFGGLLLLMIYKKIKSLEILQTRALN